MPKYDNFSREELIELLQKQDKELARKKYGLVWDSEKEPEQVVLECAKKLPILKNITEKDIKTSDDDYNIMMEGDNYHALQVLNYTHKGKIDVIYIDPPYNTGEKDFIYNDKYVDKEDGYRHSKWLNFMEKRLDLAKELLSDTGVIFISIDENEEANLKLLCNKIFNNNCVGTFIWRKKQGGGQADDYFVTEHEYILVYCKNKRFFKWIDDETDLKEEDFKYSDEKGKYKLVKLEKWGNTSRREDRPTMYYPIKQPNGKKYYPIAPDGNDGRWRIGKSRMEDIYKYGLIEWKENKKGAMTPYEKIYWSEDDIKVIKERSILFDLAFTSDGTNTLTNIFGKKDVFKNPKSEILVYNLISHAGTTDSTVLDFFAGSGTTGHAVLELNRQDGGNRRFILCTNNEGNIASEVCYPRIQKVIQGYNKNGNEEFIEGLGGNLKYFKTDFVVNSKNKTQTKINLAKQCSEMLCLKTGIYNLLDEENPCFKLFDNNKHNKFLCVYFDFFGNNIQEFIHKIKTLNGEKFVFMFSLDENVDRSLFEGIENIKIEPIPQKILDVYKKIAKEHIKGDNHD